MWTKLNFKEFLSLFNPWVIIPIIFVCVVAFAAIFPELIVTNNITVGGTVDGRDVAADGSVLDNLNTTLGLGSFTADEVTQLQTIDTETMTNAQWAFLGASDQGIATSVTPSYTGMVLTDPLNFSEESTPSNPASNTHDLYFKSDGNVYKLNSAGTEVRIDASAQDVFTVDGSNLTICSLVTRCQSTGTLLVREDSDCLDDSTPITYISTGICQIHFKSTVFDNAPTCVLTSNHSPFCVQTNQVNHGSEDQRFTVITCSTGTLSDNTGTQFQVHCFGATP